MPTGPLLSAPRDCPGIECWQALLDAALPPDERQRCERHLEACPACQECVHRADACDGELRLLARQIGDPTAAPRDPDLDRFLARLCEDQGPAPPGPADLPFLRPGGGSGALGLLGPYEVQEVLGRGGMGVVLKAFEPALRRPVAIKVLAAGLAGSATARRRFRREARAAAAVCHDHVVAVHAVHDVDGLPYLVMQYVAGESLQDRLDRSGPLDPAEVVRVGLQAARGLAAAHARGLVHRDVKPANILLEEGTSRVKLTDFGLARAADDVGLTQAGVVAGTPEYMAPEQARGEQVDHRADLFSLGSVLYACCTGEPPFRGATTLAVLRQVSDGEAAPVRALNADVPAWLDGLIVRLMAKDPADRFGSAAEVAELLEGCLAHLRQPGVFPVPCVPPAGAGPSGGGGARRRLGRKGWLLGLVPLAAGLAGALLLQAGPAPAPAPTGEFSQDFRGSQPPLPPLQLTGSDAQAVSRPEQDGFRITLPARRRHTDRVGLVLPTRIKGDFEITTGYEILQADQPTEGHGVGFDVFIETDTPRHDVAEVMRTVRVNEGEVYCCARISTDDEGKRTYHLDFFPTGARKGRLRLTRRGREVTLFAAEGTGGPFEELCRYDLGTEDVIQLTACAYPGFAQNPVDLRIQDLRVHLLSAPEAAGVERPAAAPRDRASRGWLAAAVVLGLVLVLTALGVWLVARRSRRGATDPSPAPVNLEEARGGEAPPIAFRCPGCGQGFKARPELGGKKVRCRQCGQAVLVPGARSGGGPDRVPS
jgi:serine/threonine-protein kinase